MMSDLSISTSAPTDNGGHVSYLRLIERMSCLLGFEDLPY